MSPEPGRTSGRSMRLLRRAMQGMARLLPGEESGGNAGAVRMLYRLGAMRDLIRAMPMRLAWRRIRGGHAWPVVSGAYVVGDPVASVAVCTLTNDDLIEPLARSPGVAIAGRVYTANLGIEKIVLNITSNPAIRFLLICGKDSPIFQPAHALRCLCANGVDQDRNIIGAQGRLPVLSNVPADRIEVFRQQIDLIDRTGETGIEAIQECIRALTERAIVPFASDLTRASARETAGQAEPERAESFVSIRPGGHRQPLVYDPKGYFIITLDRQAGEIILRHYLPNNVPAHEMRGRSAEAMLLGLLREELVTQLSHAGYLGGELAKAQAALRLSLLYEQDRPLRKADSDE